MDLTPSAKAMGPATRSHMKLAAADPRPRSPNAWPETNSDDNYLDEHRLCQASCLLLYFSLFLTWAG